jgi:hypothetical protein
MSRRFATTALLLAAAFIPAFLFPTPTNQAKPAVRGKADSSQSIGAQPDDGEIAYVTARALEQYHLRQKRLNDEYSEKFFDRYIERWTRSGCILRRPI